MNSVFLNWKIVKFCGTNYRRCSTFCNFGGTYFRDLWSKSWILIIRKFLPAKISALKVVLIQIQEFRWSKVNRKPTEKQKVSFCYSHRWPYTYICLRSHSADLDQVITITIALKRSPSSFWKLIQTGKVGYWIWIRVYSS